MEAQVKTKVVTVTPAMAQKWLNGSNSHNRKIAPFTVEAYARDMKHGNFPLSNQGIGFDVDGDLVDGQHRLLASVWSGTPFETVIVRGLPKKAQEVVDRNKQRTTADAWVINNGMKNANLKSAMVSVLAFLCVRKQTKITTSIATEILNTYSSEIEVVVRERKSVPKLVYTPVLGSFAFAAKTFKGETIAFEEKYFSGEDLKRGNPILTFRNFMLGRDVMGGGRGYRRQVMKTCLTALKCHVEQVSLKRIVKSEAGYDFFACKQKKIINRVEELFDY